MADDLTRLGVRKNAFSCGLYPNNIVTCRKTAVCVLASDLFSLGIGCRIKIWNKLKMTLD